MEETWKPIKEYEGYEVSSIGRVKSFKHKQPKILAPCESEDGYYRVGLCREGKVKLIAVHKLVAETFLTPVPGKTFIDHIDRDVKNNHISNLRFVDICEQNQNRGSKNVAINQHNINLHKGLYQVSIQRFRIRHYRCFQTLEEAIQFRDSILYH